MKILHVVSSLAPRYGGPAKACPELCRELARRGAQVSIYTTNVDGTGEVEIPPGGSELVDGVEKRYFPVHAPRHYRFSLPFARALKEAVRAFDIVHIHSLYLFPSTVAAHYARMHGVPYIVRPHGSLDPYHFRRHRARKWCYEQLIEWHNLNRAAAIHFTSLEERRLADRLRFRAPAVVVPLGVEDGEFEGGSLPGWFRRRWPETQGKKLVLFLSRIDAKKGLDVLARAFAIVAREREDVHLVLAGPDDQGYGAKVREWLEAAGVLQKCTFTGMLLGSHKISVLREADLFVLPSLTENFGVAVVEAMAAGLPVVISNRVGIWREVANWRAGLVTDRDPGQLAEALNRVLADPAQAKRMGARGRDLVRRRFSWQVVGGEMLGVYRHIVSGRAAGGGSNEWEGTH